MTVKFVLDEINTAMKKKRSPQSYNSTVTEVRNIASHEYFTLIHSYNITPSMSRRGNSYNNALAENFFSTFKTEYVYYVKLANYKEARLFITEYINFNNNYRMQTKLSSFEKQNQFVT